MEVCIQCNSLGRILSTIFTIYFTIPENVCLSRGDRGHSSQHVEQGGFAGTVVSQDGRDLSGIDFQTDSLDGVNRRLAQALERFLDVVDDDGLLALHGRGDGLHVLASELAVVVGQPHLDEVARISRRAARTLQLILST